MSFQRSSRPGLLALACFAGATGFRAQPIIWSGLGNWSDPAHWAPSTVPGVADTAQISTGSVAVTDARTVGWLLFGGGSLEVTGHVTLSSTGSAWTAGAFSGAGQTTIDAGASLSISGSVDHDFNSHVLVNNGTMAWEAGRLRSGDGGSIANHHLFIDAAASVFNADTGNHVASFTNAAGATYRKTTAGTTTFDVPLINSGTLDLQAGTLLLNAGGTFNAGATTIGAGQLRLGAGAFVGSGTMSFSNFQVAGGTLFGVHTFDGLIDWVAGNFNSSGTTGLAASATLIVSGAGDHDFNAHTFQNHGIVSWAPGAGRIRSGDGGTFLNYGSVYDDASNVWNVDLGNHIAGFVNAAGGSYIKEAAGTTTFSGYAFQNSGTVTVNAGTLDLAGGGSSAAGAHFNVASGAALRFTWGAFTLADAAAFAGDGTIGIAGAVVTLGGASALADLQLTGGTLGGTHTIDGGLLWTGGNFNAGGTTTIGEGGVFTISGIVDHDFNSHVLVNNGTTNWSAGRLRSGDGGSFTNAGMFNDSSGSTFNGDLGNHVTSFTNAAGAHYNKSAANTTTYVVPFNNSGFVDVAEGAALSLAAGGTIGAGATYSGAGAALLSGGVFTAVGGIESTSLRIAGATLAGTHVFNGTVAWEAGTLNSSGLTTIAPLSTLRISGALDHDFNARILSNNGTIEWQGGRLRTGDGGTIANNLLFIDAASDTVNADLGNHVATFLNATGATYRKTAAGTTTIAVPFTNAGTIEVLAGSLTFASTFTSNNGGVGLANLAAVLFPGAVSLGTATLAGCGTVGSTAVSTGGTVSPGTPVGALTLTGDLSLLAGSKLLIELGGAAQGTEYDFLNVAGNASLGGQLNLSFANGFETFVTSEQTFTVLTAQGGTGLSGEFANVLNGERLWTVDGAGSFQINYGVGSAFAANLLVLSDFVIVPEPSSWTLLGFGAVAVLVGFRRGRRNAPFEKLGARPR